MYFVQIIGMPGEDTTHHSNVLIVMFIYAFVHIRGEERVVGRFATCAKRCMQRLQPVWKALPSVRQVQNRCSSQRAGPQNGQNSRRFRRAAEFPRQVKSAGSRRNRPQCTLTEV